MELSNRFQWVSILKYDDEFRLLHTGDVQLHTVILEQMYKPFNPNTNPLIVPLLMKDGLFAVILMAEWIATSKIVPSHVCTIVTHWRKRLPGIAHPGHSHIAQTA